MSLEQASLPVFAGHQTFHPRFGWIKKGFDSVNEDPEIFNNPEAPLLLGVGKNMVEAIRFWGVATKVWSRIPHPTQKRTYLHVPTGFGKALLSDDGFDPFLELPGSLWLLHWYALSSPTSLPIWWLTFNEFSAVEFEDEDLDRFCLEEVASTTWKQPNPSSIKKDVDCLLHMYVPRAARGRQGFDDVVDSPFRELNIITTAPGSSGNYRFNLGSKPGATPEVIAYACFDYLARNEPDTRTATLTHLSSDPGTPGRILKLTEDAMLDAFTSIAAAMPGVALTSPAGAPQLAFDADPTDLAAEALFRHYSKRQPNLPKSELEVAGPSARKAIQEESESLPTAPKPSPRRKAAARRKTKAGRS